jgi:hypothetical protein
VPISRAGCDTEFFLPVISGLEDITRKVASQAQLSALDSLIGKRIGSFSGKTFAPGRKYVTAANRPCFVQLKKF